MITIDSPSSNYREIHFSNEYIIQRRFEEKSRHLNQNHFRVDHCFRPLKLQYQTIRSVLILCFHSFTLLIA